MGVKMIEIRGDVSSSLVSRKRSCQILRNRRRILCRNEFLLQKWGSSGSRKLKSLYSNAGLAPSIRARSQPHRALTHSRRGFFAEGL